MTKQINQKTTDPNAIFKAVRLIYLAITGGAGFLILLLYFINGDIRFSFNASSLTIAVSMLIIPILFSRILYKRILQKTGKNAPIEEKMSVYRQAAVSRAIIIEGTIFLAVILYLIQGCTLYYVVAFALLLYLIMIFPTKQRMFGDLELDFKDRQRFD